MNNMKTLIINKNRGWRGLAEIKIYNEEYEKISSMIFSFSQAVWNDLIVKNLIVIQDKDYYYVIKFKPECSELPSPNQQRSVLIKNFQGEIEYVNRYEKTTWTSAEREDWKAILNFRNNKNNHTTSDWNYIGVRVTPTI